ncbi:MAG: 30S ribosome-binding factor RbfA [Phycisphaerales bacterium]|nr:30S ribosome-binding factor RbfA [Phycisphaerales bacterium]
MRRRAQQISSTLQRELQKVMARGFNDPRIRGLITITKVELTDDLKNAKAYISVMPEERAELTMHGIKAASKRIRRDVMERIHMKEMPSLRFVYDHGMREQQVISDLLASDPFRDKVPALPDETGQDDQIESTEE